MLKKVAEDCLGVLFIIVLLDGFMMKERAVLMKVAEDCLGVLFIIVLLDGFMI